MNQRLQGGFYPLEIFEKIFKLFFKKVLTNDLVSGIILPLPKRATDKYAPLAQLVEQLTLNQLVPGSRPGRCTTKQKAGTVFLPFALCRIPSRLGTRSHRNAMRWFCVSNRVMQNKP